MKKFLKVLAALVLAFALMFTLAACGGGDGPESGTETPGTETPGTETPGTETPGTDNPGTETPGTDTPEEDSDGLSMLINALKAIMEQEYVTVTGDFDIDITGAATETGEFGIASVSDMVIKLAENDWTAYDIDFSATVEGGNNSEPTDVKFIIKDLKAYTYSSGSGWTSDVYDSSQAGWLNQAMLARGVLSGLPELVIEDLDIVGVDVNANGTNEVQLDISIDMETFCGLASDTLEKLGKISLLDYDMLIKSLLTYDVTINQLVAAVNSTLLAPIGITLDDVMAYDELTRGLFMSYVLNFSGSASQPGEEPPLEFGGGLPDEGTGQTMPATHYAKTEVYAADGVIELPWEDATDFRNSLYIDFTGTLYEFFTAIASDEVKEEIVAPNNGENGYDYIVRLFGDWTVSDFISYMTGGEIDGDAIIDKLLAAYEEYKDITLDEALVGTGETTFEEAAEMLDLIAPKGEVVISAEIDGEGRLTALSADFDFSLNAPDTIGSQGLQAQYAGIAEFAFDYSKVEITAPTAD